MNSLLNPFIYKEEAVLDAEEFEKKAFGSGPYAMRPQNLPEGQETRNRIYIMSKEMQPTLMITFKTILQSTRLTLIAMKTPSLCTTRL